jgi:N-methylhydantoinase A
MRIAMDTGGTFTDCVFLRDGKLEILKVPSQSKNPSAAIASALRDLRASLEKDGDALGKLDLVCGTTVGTNALLERRGGKVLLITTVGFEDVLEIGRQARPKLYDLQFQKPPALVERAHRLGARERLAADGSLVTKLGVTEIRSLVRKVQRTHPDAVAICFLFSFRNVNHEAAMAKALRRKGFLVSVSHEILPEFREFERTSTTVINAYLAPVMSAYLRATQSQASTVWNAAWNRKSRNAVQVRVMQSNGGIISAESAAVQPVRTVLSGPAGGVLGAGYAASLAGLEKGISFDMGGTSTDVALLSDETQITTESRVAGLPISVPMLEIHTVGAGGGSIARFDVGGALRVGPESAGADPGPICYGRGAWPTVTDAHCVLGHFGGRGLLNGGFALNLERTRRELEKRKGDFRDVETFAHGIIGVSNSVIERALRLISIERGHDPRDYTLIAFGGAGGLHACDLAQSLEMLGVLLPVFPGGLSALGILRADVVRDFSRTVLLPVQEPRDARRKAGQISRGLRVEAETFLAREGFPKKQRRFEYRLDVRYVGQAYDLSVRDTTDFVAAFHRAHERAYGHSDPHRRIEIVNVRCRATGLSPRTDLPRISHVRSGSPARAERKVNCFFGGRPIQAGLYEREKLQAGHEFDGPAIIVEYSATSLVPLGWRARVDPYGQILLSKADRVARHRDR